MSQNDQATEEFIIAPFRRQISHLTAELAAAQEKLAAIEAITEPWSHTGLAAQPLPNAVRLDFVKVVRILHPQTVSSQEK